MKDNKLPQAIACGTAQAQKFVSRYNPRDKSRGVIAQNKIIVLGLIVLLVLVVVFLAFSRRPSTVVAPTIENKPSTTETTTSLQQATQSASTAVKEVNVKAFSFGFDPKTIIVKKGEKVKFLITNSSGVHNFVIDEFSVSADTLAGKETVVEVTPDKSGSFIYYCSIGNHRAMGMWGTLVVE